MSQDLVRERRIRRQLLDQLTRESESFEGPDFFVPSRSEKALNKSFEPGDRVSGRSVDHNKPYVGEYLRPSNFAGESLISTPKGTVYVFTSSLVLED